MLDASDKKRSWLSSESWLGSKFEHSGDAFVPSRGMNHSFVYHAKNPVCARAKDDQRIIRPRIMDGRAMTKQQLRLEELAEEGRQWAKHPELKPKPRPEGRGMAFAIAHLDELLEKGKLQKQAREVASPQQPDEVFHDAVDPIDNEESIWMDTQESTESELEIMETAEDGPLPEVVETAEDGPLPEVVETAADGPLPEVVETAEDGPLPEVVETAEHGPPPEVMETAEDGPLPEVVETAEDGPLPEVVETAEHGPPPEVMETAEDGPLPEVMETAEDGPLPEVVETAESCPLPEVMETAEDGPLPEVVETAEDGPLPEVMETAEDGPLPEVMETAEDGPPPAVAESFLAGVQQNQNPFTEVEAEREDFSMWSFLRAAGLVCGCWGRWSCTWSTVIVGTVAQQIDRWYSWWLKSLRINKALIDPAPKLRLSVQMALTRTERKRSWVDGNSSSPNHHDLDSATEHYRML